MDRRMIEGINWPFYDLNLSTELETSSQTLATLGKEASKEWKRTYYKKGLVYKEVYYLGRTEAKKQL